MFQKISQKFKNNRISKIKQKSRIRVNNLIGNLSQVSVGLNRIEKSCAQFHMIMAEDWDHFYLGEVKNRRIAIVLFLNMTTLLMLIRCIFVGLYRDHFWIHLSTVEAIHLIGHPALIASLGSAGALFLLLLRLTFIYHEVKGSLYNFEFLNDIKHKRNTNQLSAKYSKKFGIYTNLCGKYFSKLPGYVFGIATSSLINLTTIIDYMDKNFSKS